MFHKPFQTARFLEGHLKPRPPTVFLWHNGFPKTHIAMGKTSERRAALGIQLLSNGVDYQMIQEKSQRLFKELLSLSEKTSEVISSKERTSHWMDGVVELRWSLMTDPSPPSTWNMVTSLSYKTEFLKHCTFSHTSQNREMVVLCLRRNSSWMVGKAGSEYFIKCD